MVKCSFCSRNYEWPMGLSQVQFDGSVKYYCSRKCRVNDKMGRDRKKVKWVTKKEK